MKRLVIALAVVVIVAVRLLHLVREPSKAVASVNAHRQIAVPTGGIATARVEVPRDKPVEMGLPAWTNVLPTMSIAPPPIDTRPPTVPAAALR